MNVKDILPLFDVSAATIRKDLAILERASLILRTRGEVHLPAKTDLTPFESRSYINRDAKIRIAKKAVEMIDDGDVIILDSGTTTLEIAELLKNNRSITVLTNSIPIAHTLSNSQVAVTVVGGMLFGRNISTQGPDAEHYFSQVEVNKVFLGASGTRSDVGLTSLTPLEASIKRCMMRSAQKVFAVFDSTKFNCCGINLFADFSELDYIITDAPITDQALNHRLDKLKLECIVAGSD